MAKIPQISHTRAIKAFKKAGFAIIKEGKHVSMFDGRNIIVTPRANPINTFTLKGIINDTGLTVEEFKKLL